MQISIGESKMNVFKGKVHSLFSCGCNKICENKVEKKCLFHFTLEKEIEFIIAGK